MWHPFDDGSSIGRRGSEGGAIVRDEEHTGGARITLEQDGYAPWSITCGVYGWMVHTRFFADRAEAERELELMKPALVALVESEDVDLIGDFVDRFP